MTEFGKEFSGKKLAETWELPCHPDDACTMKNEGQYGKTEMWYVVDCEEGASLYYRFSHEITKENFPVFWYWMEPEKSSQKKNGCQLKRETAFLLQQIPENMKWKETLKLCLLLCDIQGFALS